MDIELMIATAAAIALLASPGAVLFVMWAGWVVYSQSREVAALRRRLADVEALRAPLTEQERMRIWREVEAAIDRYDEPTLTAADRAEVARVAAAELRQSARPRAFATDATNDGVSREERNALKREMQRRQEAMRR